MEEKKIEITRKYLAQREKLPLHFGLSIAAFLGCILGFSLLYWYSKGKELFYSMHMETIGVVSVGLVIAFIAPFCVGAIVKTGARLHEIMRGRVKVDKLTVTEVEELENERFRITLRTDGADAIPYAVYGSPSTLEDARAGEKAYVVYVGNGTRSSKPALIGHVDRFYVQGGTKYL
jgi:hypothetical protein